MHHGFCWSKHESEVSWVRRLSPVLSALICVSAMGCALGAQVPLAESDPGRVTARRLNRAEYNNTIRDLTGVALQPAYDFPQDDSGYGFDNIGDVLSLPPLLMEKYMSAAEKISRTAVLGHEPLAPTLTRHQPRDRRFERTTTPLFDYDEMGVSMPNALHTTHRFPVDGEYVFRIVPKGTRPAGSEPVQIGLWIDGKLVATLEVQPLETWRNQTLSGQRREFRTRVTAGDHWIAASILRLYEGLPSSYGGPNPSSRSAPPTPSPEEALKRYKPSKNATTEQIAEYQERLERFKKQVREKGPANHPSIDYIEIGGPYKQAKGPSKTSLEKIFVCGHPGVFHQPACGEKIVSDLARRAFRRPVTAKEVNRLVQLVSFVQKQGDSFQEGISVALQAILVSPHFLFRIEQDQEITGEKKFYPISQFELASRLSYFLWSSMPDQELLTCAEDHTLRRPKVLSHQVRRMLKDSRSRALVENFGGQWLQFRALESIVPDPELFPEFEEYLRMSAQRETELFFEYIIREDRSILDFIDGGYSFLNERLANFYKIPGVKGPDYRKVNLAGTQRSGVLTQASVLTVSSYATRTSPVLRGKWILENFLNAPPPPPPPGVPELDESGVGETMSLREQMEAHRIGPICASCHVRMDPLGLGLENYDAIGAWRTHEGKFEIDASGELPDGRFFTGPEELKAILKTDADVFAECITEKLLIFALGRGLESYDERTVRTIVVRLTKNGYRFSSLVLGIVRSLPFQNRRGEK